MLEMPTTQTFAQELITRILGSALTLYMLALLLRWLGPYIEFPLNRGPFRLIAVVTDPLLQLMRKILPPMGPMDWSPVAALMAAWIVRIIFAGY